MKRLLKWSLLTVLVLALLAAGALAWYVHGKQVQRDGVSALAGLTAAVTVAYDERGVPHIRAQNEADLYRALGYVHAQDRLFQMEMLRRLARGELAEVLGPKLLEIDKLFRTLGLRDHAERYVARMDKAAPASRALAAYLDGINQFQNSHPAPLEFDVLGIKKRPFVAEDAIAVSGYMAYSFAAAFRTEPALSFVRDQLGATYLRVFDLDWHAGGVAAAPLAQADWDGLGRIAALSQLAAAGVALPQYEGSNAWAVSGSRTASGKPLLAGDPHIAFAAPAVWYEAHLVAPGFELYGHHQALNPMALLGHNQRFGWSLTMFQNDDIDLIAEKSNPANPEQVWVHGQWVDLQSREETIAVKGAAPVRLRVRRSPHGPIVTDAYKENYGNTPVAMWWTFLETDNPVLDAFYELNRADTLAKARTAASKIHAPGLNVVWANAGGDIAWWAAAKLVRRPAGVNPAFILDGSGSEADKDGFYPFESNPQEENPARGYIVSANHQPAGPVAVPGYYNLAERAQRLNQLLGRNDVKWDVVNSQALQLDTQTAYSGRVLGAVLPVLRAALHDADDLRLLALLEQWDGRHETERVAPTLFNQLLYQIAFAAMADEMGETQFKNLLRTKALDHALPRLVADPDSPWWDDRATPQRETRQDILVRAWRDSLAHLRATFGADSNGWTWGRAHTLTHAHPLGQQKPLDKLFNVGSFAAPGGREVPNNFSAPLGAAPWGVTYGPSTRRLIDFADAGQSLGINPVGQSGVLFDRHYNDQARAYMAGRYQPQHLSAGDVAAHTRGTLTLQAK